MWMILLCLSFLPLIQDTPPPVVSMDILKSSTSKFVTSVEFANAISSSTLMRFHGYFSFISIVRMKKMMQTYALLDAVGKTHSILFFAETTVSMEVKQHIEVTL